MRGRHHPLRRAGGKATRTLPLSGNGSVGLLRPSAALTPRAEMPEPAELKPRANSPKDIGMPNRWAIAPLAQKSGLCEPKLNSAPSTPAPR